MSYYTKYRPQTFAELDLISARESLSQILTSGTFSHAYLFSGPKGTGKTSSARILAKVLNCEKNSETREISHKLHEPCNICDTCTRITNGTSMACYEMDAASNRGIDDIRTLRDQVGLIPSEGRFIVYIIDEVHMLTTEAFNALLKTLEEPPAHAVFVLCTTHPQKIPDTVISRCTRVSFFKATDQEIVHSLKKAVKGEELEVEDSVLLQIASRMDGSFRDAMKTLEQLAQQASKISLSMVNEATGYGDEYQVDQLITALLNRDVNLALDEIHGKQNSGIDVGVFAKRLVEVLRERLLKHIDDGDLLQLTQRIAAAAVEAKQAIIPILPLEIAVVEWCITHEVSENPIRQLADQFPISNKIEPKNQKKEPSVIEKQKVVEQKKVMNAFVGTTEDVKGKWQDILMRVRPLNHSLEALLRSARPLAYADGWLTIEAFYKFHKEQLEQERNRKRLEETIGEILGGTVYLKFQLMNGKIVQDKQVENVTGSVTDDALVRAAEEILG